MNEESSIVEDDQDAEIMRSFDIPEPKDAEIEVDEPAIKSMSTINFYDALEQVTLGEKIHKLEWQNTNFYGFMKDELLLLHKPDGVTYQWTISKADIEGTDYVVLK